MTRLTLNGRPVELDVDPDMPLLWALREHAGLTGTKYGCGIALCGACTVTLNGQPVRGCRAPVAVAQGMDVVTIEGLDGRAAEAVREAWAAIDVAQCGYCQSGQVVAATVLLRETPKPTDADIDRAMGGHLCRCATYQRIRAAIHEAARRLEA